MGQVIEISNAGRLGRGCLICGARLWDCTVDGCKPGRNREGDVLHCKVCNTAYVVTGKARQESPPGRPRARLR
ncbi:MAG: hypothetical protein ACUVSU_13980 [Aggregatilineaceae bacterium]